MLNLKLVQYATGSFITLLDGNRHMGSITYTSKAHKFFSEGDYSTLVTEMKTYGDKELQETFNYFQASRKGTR